MIRYIFLQRLKQNSTEGFTATLIYQSTYKSPRNNRNDSYNKLYQTDLKFVLDLFLREYVTLYYYPTTYHPVEITRRTSTSISTYFYFRKPVCALLSARNANPS